MNETPVFPGRLAIQQRVLTTYRAAFFDTLAAACEVGLDVCAGLPGPEESIAVTGALTLAKFTPIKNYHFLRGRFYFCHQSGLIRWLSGCDPAELILEANPRYLSTPAAIRWMKNRGRPVLGWGLGVPASVTGLVRAQRNRFLRQFDGLLTYSRRGAEEYAATGFPAEKIFVAPNAAAHRPTRPMPSRPAQLTERPVVLFVGRLQMRKRVDLLLQACAALPEPVRPRLIIVGDGPVRKSLEVMAKTVYPSAEFTGSLQGEGLAARFTQADLFVLPGTGGLAVQEAMSYGLPVIMGQGDGTNADLVRPANGWQIPADDLLALIGALTQALADIHRLRHMGAEVYRIVSEEINLEKMVEVFVKALNLLVK